MFRVKPFLQCLGILRFNRSYSDQDEMTVMCMSLAADGKSHYSCLIATMVVELYTSQPVAPFPLILVTE